MRADETRKISEKFKKQPFVHERSMIDLSDEYESRHTTEEICSVCGLSKLETNWQEKKGIEDEWCKVAVEKSISNTSSNGKPVFDKSALNRKENVTGYALFTHFFIATQRLLSKLRF